MAMTMSELVQMREASSARAAERNADECFRAFHQGAAAAVRSVLFVVAAGEVVCRRDVQTRLDKVLVRSRQPWNLRYCAYWDGAISALEYMLDRWTAAA